MENIQEAHRLLADFDPLDAKIELFKRGEFDFIVTREIDGEKLSHEKQREALKILADNTTKSLMYGGGAGGAKSWTGCVWLAFNCLAYPGTNWFIGREEMARITKSTYKTFLKVAKEYGFEGHFKFNAQLNYIRFKNGSNIDLIELKYVPRDPDYNRYGSAEYTGGWIEEAPECNFGAYDTLKSRVNRHLNDDYDLNPGKLLLTANPSKNWAKKEFYDKKRKGELPETLKFLQCLLHENPFRESGYEENLNEIKDEIKRQRLKEGNWDYADNGNALVTYDDIQLSYSNDHVQGDEFFITADVARYGSDKAVILVWRGWAVIDYKTFDLSSTTEIAEAINNFRYKYDIPEDQCIADQDGVGSGVVDQCGIIGFVNNAKPFTEASTDGVIKPQYNNLQTQCGYYLAEQFANYEIWLAADFSPQEREELDEEIGVLKGWKVDDDNKVYLLPKKEIKKLISRSPDWRDALLMRSFFDLSGGMTSMETYWS